MVNFYFSKEIKNPELPLTHEQKNIIREYCSLASLSSLSESEAQRIADIQEIAQIDQILDFWITEADYVIGQKLKLINENEQKNFQARLREYLVTDCGNLKPIIFRHTK
ncbi:hypothetical protein [Nostoc sp. ChiQUE01b]|uniref:hypothetical protein n=1 Tax=Nostoc sp. ChiQUE01b TaxID=3075376 RepID=UPI002AD3449C|nr:hypothetical protein [Nostoc sp. ChiQUE01b]MDZ8262743.1 hypothetical protein [Nostoc sp. ChiQUE01b]